MFVHTYIHTYHTHSRAHSFYLQIICKVLYIHTYVLNYKDMWCMWILTYVRMYKCHIYIRFLCLLSNCSSVVEIFCLKDQTSSASESNGTASFVVTRNGSATDRSCIGYTVGDVSTQGMNSTVMSSIIVFPTYLMMHPCMARLHSCYHSCNQVRMYMHTVNFC